MEITGLTPHAAARCIERGIPVHKLMSAVSAGICLYTRTDGSAVFRQERLVVALNRCGLVITAFRLPKLNPKRTVRKLSQEKRCREREYFRGSKKFRNSGRRPQYEYQLS